MPTVADYLADAQDAAAKLRKTFDMSQTNGRTNGHVAEAISVPTEQQSVAETQPALDASQLSQAAEKPAPFRAKNARALGNDAIAGALSETQERMAATTAKMDQIADKLAAVLSAPGAPHAAIASPAAPSQKSAEQIASDITAAHEFGKLRATLLKNGDMSFELPFDIVRSSVAALTGEQREAFREVGKGVTQHLELTGDSDRQIRAAMEYAKQRWDGDAVVIRVGDANREKIVRHAVAANLNIDLSRDPKLAELVAEERKRQSVDKSVKTEVTVLERVQVANEKKKAEKQDDSVAMRV